MKNGIFITIFGLIEPFITPTDDVVDTMADEQNEEIITEEK